jgi:serine/threonine protein kinase
MDEVEFGRYRLLGLIGEGGMGQVYRARDSMIPRDVAVKILPAELASQPGYQERFRREAHTAAQLAEPHVIPIFDTGEIDGRLFLVMPIVKGVDLASMLHRDGPMNASRAVRIIEQLASALDAAHAQGLVHRDVKPSNALITGTAGRDFAYLIDFGIVHDSAATKLTRTGSVIGTLAYMSPERFSTGKADARADIYALGCVLYECLTGSQPFPGNSMEQQIAGHLTAPPPRPSQLQPAIPTGFDDVIARVMAKNPDDRYQSAQGLVDAAEQALVQPVDWHRPPTPGPAFVDSRRPTEVRAAGPTMPGPHARPPNPRTGPRQPAELPVNPPTASRQRNVNLAIAASGVALAGIGYVLGIGILLTAGGLVAVVAIVMILFSLRR